MGVEENKENIRRSIEEVYNRGDMSVVNELIAPDFVVPGESNIKGPEGIKSFATTLRTAFPDFHMTIEEMVGEGDNVAAYLTWTGTHKGEFMGIAPTDKQIKNTGAYFYKFKDGKQIETKGISNQLSMYQQLGATPPTG